MNQTLFYVPPEWAGVPVFGFGWALLAWVLFGVALMVYLVRTYGWNAETRSYLPVLLLVAGVLWLVLPTLEQRAPDGEPLGLPVRGYGVMVLLGVIAGVGLAVHQARQMGLESDVIFALAFWMFVGGILGARAFYVIEYWEDFRQPSWRATLLEIVKFTEGGLVVYGSFIGGVVAAVAFVRNRRLPALAIGDLIAPSLVLGLALGRIGCLLNGCCFGGLCEYEPLSITFPRFSDARAMQPSPPYQYQRGLGLLHGMQLNTHRADRVEVAAVAADSEAEQAGVKAGDIVAAINGQPLDGRYPVGQGTLQMTPLEEARLLLSHSGGDIELRTEQGRTYRWSAPLPPRSLPVHATQIYSALNAVLLCFLLWAFYPFRRRDGEVFALMLTVYPVTRFLLEMIRTDEPGMWGTSLSISQWVSVVMLVLMVGTWTWLLRRPHGSALPV